MADGIGCKCFASYQGECACDADWTPSEVYELRAHINDLREALEVCKYECHTGEVIGIAQQALLKTPAQSLQSVINETIEECAKVCEEIVIENPGRADLTVDQCAKTIRALKVSND